MSAEFWNGYFAVVSFLFGACVGSFLNVCIYRIPREESVVRPRSHCPHCNRMIAWYDNIPLVSWCALGARCRHCGNRISARYVLVELLVAVLFLLVWLRYGFDARTPVYWLMAGGLTLGTFVDFEHMYLPDRVTLGGIVAGLVLSPLVPSLHGETARGMALLAAGLGATVGYGLLWLVAFLGEKAFKKEAMGMGDVKLLGAVGALLGWPAVLFTIFVSSLFGSIVGVAFIVARRKEWQSRIPFGPYIALAAVLWFLGGADLWHAYFGWLTGVRVQ